MSDLVQTIIVFIVIGACVAYVAWQGVSALFGRRSRVGACCSKGCSIPDSSAKKSNTAKAQFIPVELLVRRK
jgi:hypothetical protein